jgi:hypothetical protein
MTVHQAKKDLANRLAGFKVEFQKLTARTVSFEDLARANPIFITIHQGRFPKGFELKMLGVPKSSDGGYIVECQLCTWNN